MPLESCRWSHAVGVRNLFRWSTEFIPLEYGIYSVGVRNGCRWSTEWMPLEYGMDAVGVRNLFRFRNGINSVLQRQTESIPYSNGKRNQFRTPTANGINSVLQRQTESIPYSNGKRNQFRTPRNKFRTPTPKSSGINSVL